MEKGEIAHFEQFHLFPRCFPEALLLNVLKRVYKGRKGLSAITYHKFRINIFYLVNEWGLGKDSSASSEAERKLFLKV